MDRTIYPSMKEFLDGISAIDTHEHFVFPRTVAAADRDILAYVQNTYISDDLRSVGFGPREFAEDIPPREKWERVKAALRKTENTTYFRALDRVFRDLFAVGGVLSLDYETASAASREHAAMGEDWYTRVLESAGISRSIVDHGQTTDFEFRLLLAPKGLYTPGMTGDAPESSGYDRFRPVLRIDFLTYCYLPQARRSLEERLGVRADTLDELEGCVERLMPALRKKGFVGVKCCLGYFRDLHFLPRRREEAEAAFRAGEDATEAEARAFSDYMVYLLARLAGENGIPFEIHTGLRCFGSAYTTGNGPHELTELATLCPETRFDFFHSGWPWTWQAMAMAKSIPNVWLSLNWLTAINETQAEHFLREALDAVPLAKITWGGDSYYVEEGWAHMAMMRELLARVLTEEITSGHFSEELCRTIGRAILHDNAAELYSLE